MLEYDLIVDNTQNILATANSFTSYRYGHFLH